MDVVHLTTPNHLHHDQVRDVLAAGKHVVCEKPLAMNSEETAELLELAEESGLVHAVNFNIRFYAQNQAARARVTRGEIGDVRLISGGYLQDWLLLDTDWNWRLDPAAGGSLRAVGDIGSHWIDLVTFITGRHVEAVMADLTTFINVRKQPTGPVETFSGATAGDTIDTVMETEDAAGILLRLTGGARAVADGLAGIGRTQEPAELGDRRLRSPRSRGTPRRRRSCGSVTATARTSSCCVRPATTRPAMRRGSPTPSSTSTAPSTPPSRTVVRRPNRTTPPSPTAMRRR